jgi:hypothetical protein
MTSDEFNSHYKLLKQMAVQEGRSYTAEHRPSGRAVLVHVLDERQLDGPDGVQAMIERLAPRDRSRVLATMTIDHSAVVVTQFLQGFEGFEPWLREKIADLATPPPPSPGPADGQHGEFTRLFRAENTPVPPPGWPAPPPTLRAGATPPPGSNFTDLFRAPAPPSPGSETPDSATIPPVRMVGVRLPSSPESPLILPEPPSTPPAPPRLVPTFETPGPRPANLAGWPQADEVIIRSPGQPVAPLPPPSWTGPSEYTRLLGSISPPTGELAPVSLPAEPGEERSEPKRSYIPLFVVLNVVFILATGLVVYFALRQC